MFEEINYNRRNRRRFLAITAMIIAAYTVVSCAFRTSGGHFL